MWAVYQMGLVNELAMDMVKLESIEESQVKTVSLEKKRVKSKREIKSVLCAPFPTQNTMRTQILFFGHILCSK